METMDVKNKYTLQGPTSLSGYATIKFIEIIRERPEVWDSRSTEYKVKDVKQHAWKSIAAAMNPDFHDLKPTEQNLVVHSWMRRWKSLRDCYTREVNKEGTKKRKYIYFDHLTFLNDVIGARRFTFNRRLDDLKQREGGYNDDEPQNTLEELYSGDLWSNKEYFVVHPRDMVMPDELIQQYASTSKHRDDEPQPVAVYRLTDSEDDKTPGEIDPEPVLIEDSEPNSPNSDDHYVQPIEINSETSNSFDISDEDPDRLFLLSLVSDLKRISNKKKILVKSKILSIIEDAMTSE